MQDGEGGERVKFLSSLAKQRNIAQLFLSYFYIGALFKKKKKKEKAENLSERYKGKKLAIF